MEENYIDRFKAKGTEIVHFIKAQTAETALHAENATSADNADAIGNVEKYSGVHGGKQREGLKINNGIHAGIIEVNSKGNLAIESLADTEGHHLNLESSKGIQIKPTTTIIFDSSRRILSGKGNEVQIEAKFDDYKNFTGGTAPDYSGLDGNDEAWAELKLKSRNLDLRCQDHGGIALQIAGQDGHGNENKIKFESDRTSPIGSTGTYNGEGGKGLEFGTFNNEHASLFCGDYRFKGDANVYGVTRGAIETTSTGKMDYPTQRDDFKDILDEDNKASWNEIIGAAKKCSGKESIASENFVTTKIAEAQMSGGSISLDGYATEEYVQNYVATACPAPDLTNYYTKSESEALSSYVNSVVFKKAKNGNVEISAEGKTQGPDCEEPKIIGYKVGDEIFATIEEANAYIAEHGGEIENIYENSSLDLVSNGKVAVKAGKDFEFGGKDITIPIEISKKNKYSCGEYEINVNSLAELENVMPKLKLSIEENNSTIGDITTKYPVGEISVSIVDLIKLISRVTTLEDTITELTSRIETLEGYHTGE